MAELREEILQKLRGRVCLMGIGNPELGDSAFGVRLAENLVAAEIPGVVVAGIAPERALPFVAQGFDHIVFVGTANCGGPAGSAVLMNAREIISRFPQNSHGVSLGTLAKSIEATRAIKAWMIAVQPARVALDNQLTSPVQSTLENLTDMLSQLHTGPEPPSPPAANAAAAGA